MPPSEAVYVGDAETDAEAARRAGMPFVAVLSGVTPPQTFARYDLLEMVKDLTELPILLDRSHRMAPP